MKGMTSPKSIGEGEANRSTPRVSLSPPMGSSMPPNASAPLHNDDMEAVNSSSLSMKASTALSESLQTSSATSSDMLERTLSSQHDDQTEYNSVDPRFVLPKCVLPPRTEMESIAVFVANAIKEQSAQQDMVQNYLVILDAFRYKKDLSMLRKFMIALRTAGSTLALLASDATKHARLIHSIVRFSPFPPETVSSTTAFVTTTSNDDLEATNALFQKEFDTSLADAHFHFIVALLSANSIFLIPSLTALWKLLTFQISAAHPHRTLRIHAALATITRLVPKAKTELLPIIHSHTPFRMRPPAELVYYYQQCIHVLEYLPQLRGSIIELMVSRCLELDVEIKITDHGDATIDIATTNDTEDGAVFQLDLDDQPNVSATEADELLNSNVTVDAMADKLDSLMFTLLQYIEHTVETGISSPSEIFQILSSVFESAILITHKSKFVQFLVLHVCGLESRQVWSSNNTTSSDQNTEKDASLYRDFAAMLIEIILDPYRATVTRQSAACYLASFVSRASFVCVETVCESVDALLRWAEAYMHSLGDSNPSIFAPDSRDQCHMHSLFYTVCQSAFYIMCFRGTEAVQFSRRSEDNTHPSIDLDCARWTNICSHPLLPLRYCLESVRSEFLRTSKIFSLLDNTVLNRLLNDGVQNGQNQPLKKKRSSFVILTPATLERERLRGGVGGLGRGTNPLDSFFPFDPYLLRRSYCYIDPFYNHWDGGVSEDVEDDDFEDENMAVVVDSDSDDESTQQPPSVEDESSDSESEVEDESEVVPADVVRRKWLMSVASNATSISSRPSSVEDRGVGTVLAAKRLEMKKAWSAVVKRPRAPSCSENGSW